MIPNYKEIFDAWVTSINPSTNEKILAQERLNICEGCEHRKELFKNNGWSEICKLCGCPLSKKVYSKFYNSCPIKKWEEVDVKFIEKLENKNNKTII